ncbi:hypothetical protein MGLY_28160 [Neomoorella glycerini]|uniref:Uncharacterized protein n=1 Tax=Neomoorella glycerini TaxID=55779 RepID=A0A6I5ZUL7_9FIRM|nr:hypothetical protein [Moorella glycerini]QGP93408.1 hypothetical protein MGLY_28160 [Moorella glycerini]
MSLKDHIKNANREGSGLGFLHGRKKGDFEWIIGKEIALENAAIVQSNYNDGAENVIFTVQGDNRHYYRTGGNVVVNGFKEIAEGLEEEGLSWDIIGVTFNWVKSKNGRAYYTARFRDLRSPAEGEDEAI